MITLSPKARYLAVPGEGAQTPASRWADLMASGYFQDGAQAAIGEYSMRLKAANPIEATQAYYKLEGARDFLKLLLNIGEKDSPPSQRTMVPLNPI